MPGRRCSACGNRSREGFISSYLAWYPELNVRVAYRVLHCAACGPDYFKVLSAARGNLADGPVEGDSSCAACGTDTGGVWCVTYASLFVPHQDRVDIELWNCDSCSLSFRALIMDTGTKLPDREPLRAPAQAAISPWAKLLLE